MLSGRDADEETATAAQATAAAESAEHPACTATTASANESTTSAAIALQPGASLATKRLPAKKPVPGRTTFSTVEDEESAPKKAMILLDYTEQELRELADQTQQYLAHPDDFESLEEDFTGKKRNLLAGTRMLYSVVLLLPS
jgi:cell pole-organizing protein PopZ